MAYLVNHNTLLQEQTTSEVPETIVPYLENAEPEVVIIGEFQPVTVPTVVSKRVAVTEPVGLEKVSEETPVQKNLAGNRYNEIAVPDHLQSQNTKASLDPYYFPPVDVNNAIAVNNELKANAIDEEDEQEEVAEKKAKVYSPSREKKLRPKKKRSGSFSYGRINRYKDPK